MSSLSSSSSPDYSANTTADQFSQFLMTCESLKPWAIVSALGLAYFANKIYSRRSLNHFTTSSFNWQREIVLVTGGAGGIGGATVQRLAEGGTTVVVVDIRPLTYKLPRNVFYYQCDITDYNRFAEVADRIRRDVGDPTVVVANAGVCRGKPILEASQRDIELTFGVNTLGLLWTVKLFLPSLAANNHGHLLIVASQTGHVTACGIADYSASKAAAISIYEGLHCEMKHVHKAPAVRVSCIQPSHVKTDMFTGIKPSIGMATMTVDAVAGEITRILHSGNAHNVLLPFVSKLSPFSRALPDWLRVLGQDITAHAGSELKPHDPYSMVHQ